jgi:ATP-dependent DNA ligase
MLVVHPPIEVALARPAATLSAVGQLPGGAMFEPKWDGFRMLLAVNGGDVSLWSRQGTNLTDRFPEIVAAAAAQLPDGVLLDGEVVIWRDDRLVFDALLSRINRARAGVARMARELPASYVAFDVLGVAGEDARNLPLRDRRALLDELAVTWTPPMNVSPVTTDQAVAAEWFASLRPAGIEGIVAKGAGQAYHGGQRSWVKVKQRETLDVLCAAVTGTRRRPEEAVLGLPVDGELRIVGRTSPLTLAQAATLGAVLHPPVGEHPWPTEVKPGALDRFNRGGRDVVELTLVEPIVVEISADVAMTGHSFRHAVRFLRPRPEIDPAEVQATR